MARISTSRPRAKIAAKAETAAQTSRLIVGEDGMVAGFVIDPNHPERRFTVEILLDGLVAATSYADSFVPELSERGLTDGCYGFAVGLEPDRLAAAASLEARIANLGTPVGNPIDLTRRSESLKEPRPMVNLRWLGGQHFSGWIDTEDEAILEVAVDGETVSQIRATAWTRLGEDGDGRTGRNVRAFDFHVPERFADGRVHRVTLCRDSRDPLPVLGTFVAFPDGLAAAIEAVGDAGSDRIRGELYDRLIPASLPLAEYASWLDRFRLPEPQPSDLQLAVVVAGPNVAAENTLATLETQTHPRWIAGAIESTSLALDSDLLKDFLHDAGQADVIVFAMAGVDFRPNALARIAAAFDAYPRADALYGDLDFLANDGRLWPLAFPAFDYERMLEQGYCAHLFAARQQAVRAALEANPNNLYRLFNALLDRAGPQETKILHLPGALATLPRFDLAVAGPLLASATAAHLLARNVVSEAVQARGTLFPAVHVRRSIPPLTTTVIIPTRDRVSLLATCIDSIAPAVARSGAEILVIDNDSTDPDTLAYLAELPRRGVRTQRIEGPFNFARLNNEAAAAVETDVLCLLNNDIEATSDDWLEEMLTRLSEPDVGAVGALLTWPGGVVQHGGVVLSANHGATHAFTDRLAEDPGYLDLLRVGHECSAVTAACLLTRRADYLGVGCMDQAHFPVAFNDIDYCLRLREAGKRIVFTPHARLVHSESVSRGSDDRADRRDRYEREINSLRARWEQCLVDDPAYNPQLSRDRLAYASLAWPPGPREPRLNLPPQARDLPPGF